MYRTRWRKLPKLVLGLIGVLVWVVGLAGLPDAWERWMSEWLPAVWPLLSNPGFYGPAGVVGLLILYDEVRRYRARSGRLEYILYVAIREEDNLFGPADFLHPKRGSASKTDTLMIPRAEKAWVAFAAPAFLADPVLVDPNAQGINQFRTFEQIPGTFELEGVKYRAWRSAHDWNDLLLDIPLVVRHRQAPEG